MPASTPSGARAETAATILVAALESKALSVGNIDSKKTAEQLAAAFKIIYAGIVDAETGK